MRPTSWRRTARAVRTVAMTALLAGALTAGPASAAPVNPLVPETAAPEVHPAGPEIGDKLARFERAEPPAPAPVPTPTVSWPAPAPTIAPTTPTPTVPAVPAPPAVVAPVKPITSKRFTGFAFPSCAPAGGSAAVLAAVHSAKTRKLRWVLTNDGSVTKTGSVSVRGHKSAAQVTKFSVSGLPVGAYHLDFRTPGSTKVSVRLPVLVLGCAQATASCRGVTFTNPAGNPAVELDYGPAGDEGDGGFFTLGPGASRAVRTDLVTLVWSASRMTRQTQSSAGESPGLTVPQNCPAPVSVPGDNSLTSYGLADCFRTGSVGARLELGFDRLKDIAVRFEVRNAAGAVVLHGDAGAQVEAVGFLPGAGSYRYRTYLNGTSTAYEDVSFTVLDCLRVKRTCSSVTFTNPNPLGLEVTYATKTGKHERTIALAGGATTKVGWKYQNFSWTAYPAGVTEERDLGPRLFSIAGDVAQPRPSSC